MAATAFFPSATPRPLIHPIILHSSFKCVVNGHKQTYDFPRRILSISPTKRPYVVVVSRAGSTGNASHPSGRFRLHNLGPQPGAKKKRNRKGRGNSAGQGNTCGFGMKGQKARSHPGIKRHFEGGQNPLCRRIPKLRGDGNRKGVKKFIAVNLKSIDAAGFREGEEVSLETLKEKRIINRTGKKRKLPLKILGDGDVSLKLDVKARAFSKSAWKKLVDAGCTITKLRGPKKWLRPSILRKIARTKAFFARRRAAVAAKAAAAAAAAESQSETAAV